MDAQSIHQEAGKLTEWLASQVEFDHVNGALNAKYPIGYTTDSSKSVIAGKVHQIGDALKCAYINVIEGYFVVVEPHAGDLLISIFLVYKRASPANV